MMRMKRVVKARVTMVMMAVTKQQYLWPWPSLNEGFS